jgi:hypothetical protein
MVADMRKYHADGTRDGKLWLIQVREISRSTQALRYRDMPGMTGIRGDEYDLHLTVRLRGSSCRFHSRPTHRAQWNT